MHRWAQGCGSCPHSFMSALNTEKDQHQEVNGRRSGKIAKKKEMVDEKITLSCAGQGNTEKGDEREGDKKGICQLPRSESIHSHVPKTEMY